MTKIFWPNGGYIDTLRSNPEQYLLANRPAIIHELSSVNITHILLFCLVQWTQLEDISDTELAPATHDNIVNIRTCK
jgi:hypothetical protein